MYHFGVGNGRLSKAEIKQRCAAAKKYGAQFITIHGNNGSCVCGHGCSLDTCPVLHFYFSAPNLGEPFDSATARAVASEIE